MKEKKLTIVIAVVITALIVGGGIYWWQQSVLEEVKNETKQQIDDLQNELDDLQNQFDQEISQKNLLQQEMNDLTKKPERYVKIISPNGGENICLDEETIIEWNSGGVDTVGVRVIKQEINGNRYYYIGLDSVTATYNEEGTSGKGTAVWKVKDIPAGDGYKIEIISTGLISKISDTSDGVFSVLLCQG